MDSAVALVQAYLQVNGYFTVTEYPVLEGLGRGKTRAATDLDVLAFRFPSVAATSSRGGRRSLGPVALAPDPELGVAAEDSDMIVAEVKQGLAQLNSAARDPLVLQAALVRFGCCHAQHVPGVVDTLLRKGRARTHLGHVVRLLAFGSKGRSRASRYQVVTLGHVVAFLQDYLARYWDALAGTQLSQPALNFLAVLEKARRGDALRPAAYAYRAGAARKVSAHATEQNS